MLTLLLDILIMETITIFLKLLIVPYIKAHIHSGKYLLIIKISFIIRILYLYMFDEQIDIVLNKVNWKYKTFKKILNFSIYSYMRNKKREIKTYKNWW